MSPPQPELQPEYGCLEPPSMVDRRKLPEHLVAGLLPVDDPGEPGAGVGAAGGAVQVEPVARGEGGREAAHLGRELRDHC